MTKVNDYKAGEADKRPWGTWEVLSAEPGFAVKRIEVLPGQILSLQKHHHRAEHWVIAEGIADVTIGDQIIRKQAGEAAYIPVGEVHRIANPGDGPLVFIEVQLGDRLEESDIVRLEDSYGRAG
ncbi:MAG: phosphomannose isomerase type II C-terminal cupin domain [Sphingomonadales bacterium]